MRETLFRGKTKSGEWAYGVPVPVTVNTVLEKEYVELVKQIEYDELDGYVPLIESEEILPETLGQYIEDIDHNGVKIFEGDIIKTDFGLELVWHCHECPETSTIKVDAALTYNGYDFSGNRISLGELAVLILDPYGDGIKVEIVGNVFDNIDLLGDFYGKELWGKERQATKYVTEF